MENIPSTETKQFHVAVDDDGKATEFKFCSAKRPHMRMFYVAIGEYIYPYTMYIIRRRPKSNIIFYF